MAPLLIWYSDPLLTELKIVGQRLMLTINRNRLAGITLRLLGRPLPSSQKK